MQSLSCSRHNEELHVHIWKADTIWGLVIAILCFLLSNIYELKQIQSHVAESFCWRLVTCESTYLACASGAGGVHDKPDVGHAT